MVVGRHAAPAAAQHGGRVVRVAHHTRRRDLAGHAPAEIRIAAGTVPAAVAAVIGIGAQLPGTFGHDDAGGAVVVAAVGEVRRVLLQVEAAAAEGRLRGELEDA